MWTKLVFILFQNSFHWDLHSKKMTQKYTQTEKEIDRPSEINATEKQQKMKMNKMEYNFSILRSNVQRAHNIYGTCMDVSACKFPSQKDISLGMLA